MAKKKATKKKTQKKISFEERFKIPKNDEEHLMGLIAASRRAITGSGDSLDQLFEQQAVRIEKQLEALRNKK